MTERLGVEIDYCPACRGVWLDRGELDKILERNHESPPGLYERDDMYGTGDARPNARASEARRHGPEPYRKKSFLRDLFDFD